MLKKLFIASHNQNKLAEISSMIQGKNIEILSSNDIKISDVEETGKTFEENALLKARQGYKETKLPTLADDSGFCIKALNNNPGVYSARFAKDCGSYENAFAKLEEQMKNQEDKEASFVCVFALCTEDQEIAFKGEVKGTVDFPARGENGFAYDAIFTPNGYTKTFAELKKEEKNKISHRKKALEKLLAFLNKENAQ